MTEPIRRLSLPQFLRLLDAAELNRTIDSVHLHHTWRPRQSGFRGRPTVEAMRRYHTETNGWSDIAQHLTIDPAGGLWTGRNWNAPPASSSGKNGNRQKGPFMIEMIGDFDLGQDLFMDPQRTVTLSVVAALLDKYGLTEDQVQFHRQLGSPKTCPGSGIDHGDIVGELAVLRGPSSKRPKARKRSRSRSSDPVSPENLPGIGIARGSGFAVDPSTAEVPENEGAGAAIERMGIESLRSRQRSFLSRGGILRAAPGVSRDHESWDDLRLHVVNLSRGELSSGGQFETTPDDLEAIIGAIASYAQGSPFPRVVLYAHGGLVNEKDALNYARKMRPWWLRYGVYPVFFVWESGLLETICQYIAGPRDIFDYTTDPAIELAAKIPATAVWSGMKESARRASRADASNGNPGGAWLFARRLAALMTGTGHPPVSVHAVGHSAGAIFHSHLLPLLLDLGVPVTSLSLLAPAARSDLFIDRLLSPVLEKQIEKLTVFTMEEEAERQDNVAFVYRKSLLYFVSGACEGLKKAPILGLEESLRRDARLAGLFGLDNGGTPSAELQFSLAPGEDPNPLTAALRHGDFDNDPATMSAVLRRILDVPDDLDYGREGFPFKPLKRYFPVTAPHRQPADPPATPSPGIPVGRHPSADGRRSALCIGIDDYQDRPLSGCVNDARRWGASLEALGFEVDFRLNEAATRQAILDDLGSRIESASAGDVLVFQYSGHGTQLPDLDDDESDRMDEAFVPYDYFTGSFLVDDDLADLLIRLPQGVIMTLFMDCCHSGTISRFAPAIRPKVTVDERVRFLPASHDLVEAHRSFREALSPRGRTPSEESLSGVIHFAACQDNEYAWESAGQGDFTAAATPLLSAAVERGETNETFLESVRTAVVAKGRQHPMMMEAHGGMAGRRLLSPLVADGHGGGSAATVNSQLLTHLEAMIRLVKARPSSTQ